jgi:hypothetical protein
MADVMSRSVKRKQSSMAWQWRRRAIGSAGVRYDELAPMLLNDVQQQQINEGTPDARWLA